LFHIKAWFSRKYINNVRLVNGSVIEGPSQHFCDANMKKQLCLGHCRGSEATIPFFFHEMLGIKLMPKSLFLWLKKFKIFLRGRDLKKDQQFLLFWHHMHFEMVPFSHVSLMSKIEVSSESQFMSMLHSRFLPEK
jgi:hypothetical protein